MKSKSAQKILQSVKVSYDTIAGEFADTRKHPWAEFEYFRPYLQENAEIVDVGCGNGRLLTFLYQHFLDKAFRYVGVDNSESLLSKAKNEHGEGFFMVGDMLEIPLGDKQADIVFCIAAFHHLPNTQTRLAALNEMKRICKKNGFIVIAVWNLWQRKYLKQILMACTKSLFSFGLKKANDLYIPWKNGSGKTLSKRYYHAFLPGELIKLCKRSELEIFESFSVVGKDKTTFSKGRNFCLILKNISET